MTIKVPANNPTLLQSQVSNVLVQPLVQESTFLSAGPQIFDTNQTLRIPRIASGVTAGFFGPGTQITDGDVTFDEVVLLPTALNSLKVLTRVSNEMLRQSVVALDATLKTTLVSNVAQALDKYLWDGDGASNTIKGIFRQSGITTGTLDLTDPDTLIDAIATAQGNHVNPTHWVMTADSFAKIRKVKVSATDKRYVIDTSGANVQAGVAFQLFGLPVIITENIPKAGATPKARVGLVDMSKVAVARDLDAEIKVLDQTWGDYDSQGIRVVTRYDVGLLQAKGVTLLTEA
ncbi:phage major capsid protein [Mycolicibacterium sp. CBMA 226]|uniref:phage major capsid protein n=1 Tax=Mycolicibacterium sp. CBMA 226 TaxID=2606611 RepID=UPI0012DBDF58|nr:phage major capsid protein [Mycolicibacterium sp. CBMA 226]MUL78641.1 phage major capsid protein [Mycolicibacterium sp. CBMA 226]